MTTLSVKSKLVKIEQHCRFVLSKYFKNYENDNVFGTKKKVVFVTVIFLKDGYYYLKIIRI